MEVERGIAPLEDALLEGLNALVWLKVYARLPIEQREDVLQRVVEVYARVFDFAPSSVFVKRNRRPASWYGTGTILLDSRMVSSSRDALFTVLHEATHNWQKAVVNRLRRGEISSIDPIHPIALLWESNFRNYLMPSQGRFELYERQPLEFFANRFAGRIVDRLSFLNDDQESSDQH